MGLSRENEEQLAVSLSARTTELLPFLPYLLQDFWELGSDPDVMARMIDRHVNTPGSARILDLACGKGAVSVKVAQKLGVTMKGIDLMPEFIEYATQKAREFHVDDLCEFQVADINEAVKTHRGYDAVIFGAAGMGVLGGPSQALEKLKATIKPGGLILIEEGYIPDDRSREDIRSNADAYLPLGHWIELFRQANLELVETASGHSEGDLDGDAGMSAIAARAGELTEMHPDKIAIFEGYVSDQRDEYADLGDALACVTWVLRKSLDASIQTVL